MHKCCDVCILQLEALEYGSTCCIHATDIGGLGGTGDRNLDTNVKWSVSNSFNATTRVAS
jgi:hypothetical protein